MRLNFQAIARKIEKAQSATEKKMQSWTRKYLRCTHVRVAFWEFLSEYIVQRGKLWMEIIH